ASGPRRRPRGPGDPPLRGLLAARRSYWIATSAQGGLEMDEFEQARRGGGWAVANLDDLGDGPGFRKVRHGLGVTAFGVNAIVLPPGIETGFHFHDEQEELYFVHRGEIEIEFGD